ncbi:MAG: histidinol-phosphate transaminase [Thiobacillaceae bacterium]|nr:histidinol-phosphate transaminase [Thiobacillaceae bacterium]
MSPEALIRPELLRLAAYHVPDARGLVKLDAMENPYALPGELAQALGRRLAAVPLNRYPDPRAQQLQAVLRREFAIPDGLGLLLGNGSDELIQIIALALARPGAVLLSVEPSFVMYRLIAEYAGLRYVGVPLTADFELDTAALLAAMQAHRPAVIFLAYPNNPTGNAFDRAALEAVIEAAPGLVVVDEAYHAFTGGLSFLDAVPKRDNLLLMRTLSKLGLAGLRLGYLVGAPRWIEQFDKLRLPYNVNALSQCAAAFALEQMPVLSAQAHAIVAERERLALTLAALPGVRVYPSRANFLLLRLPQAAAVFEGLKRRGVLVKNLHGSHPLLTDCLRVTVGTPEENQVFLDALQAELDAIR